MPPPFPARSLPWRVGARSDHPTSGPTLCPRRDPGARKRRLRSRPHELHRDAVTGKPSGPVPVGPNSDSSRRGRGARAPLRPTGGRMRPAEIPTQPAPARPPSPPTAARSTPARSHPEGEGARVGRGSRFLSGIPRRLGWLRSRILREPLRPGHPGTVTGICISTVGCFRAALHPCGPRSGGSAARCWGEERSTAQGGLGAGEGPLRSGCPAPLGTVAEGPCGPRRGTRGVVRGHVAPK